MAEICNTQTGDGCTISPSQIETDTPQNTPPTVPSDPACDQENVTGGTNADLPVRDRRGELVEETAQSGSFGSKIPIGQSRRDLEFVIRKNAEQFLRLYPTVNFVRMDRVKSRPDPLYGEQIFKKFQEPTPVHAHFQFSPPEQLLRKYGIEEEGVCIATFSNRLLNKEKLKVKTGDRIEYLGVTYEILNVKQVDYFANVQVALNSVAVLKQIARR